MPTQLKRNLDGKAHLERGEYFVDPALPSPTTKRETFVCCPECGFVASITETHQVDPQRGTTTPPIYSCPIDSCAFFGRLVLELYSWAVV